MIRDTGKFSLSPHLLYRIFKIEIPSADQNTTFLRPCFSFNRVVIIRGDASPMDLSKVTGVLIWGPRRALHSAAVDRSSV